MSRPRSAGRSGTPTKSLRIHGTIARDLGIAITSGKCKPGDILSGEVASSERLEISRTAYREAVRILAAKGLVESRPKVGTKVTPRHKWHMLDPDVLGWAFENEPDLDLLQSLFELRNIVESAAAALAAERRTPQDLEEMRDAIGRMARFTLATEAGRQGDQDFHAALLRATGNPYIMSLTTGVNAAVNTTTIFKQRSRPLSRDPVPDHLRVFKAVADRNPTRAHREMSKLIELALQDTPLPGRAKLRHRADATASKRRT
jgi:DNA-binding FadR family transcriptional regulator